MKQAYVLVTGVLLALVSLPAMARADQCAVFDKEVGERVKFLVKKGDFVTPYCQACGDKAPGAESAVKTISVKSPGGAMANFYEVIINGKSMDLAYVYYRRNKRDTARNLAKLAHCEADSSETIAKKVKTAQAK